MGKEYSQGVERRPRALSHFIMMQHLLEAAREPMERDARKKLVAAAVVKGGNVLKSKDDFVRGAVADSFHAIVEEDRNLAVCILSAFKASNVMKRGALKRFLGYPTKGMMFPKA